MLKKIEASQLSSLTQQAKHSPRLRAHSNVHDSLDASVQRLFIATEPDTYIRPHRHPQAHKWELFTVLDGAMDFLLFDDHGHLVERVALGSNATRAIELAPNQWHSYVCKASGTLALEIKEGAYIPSTEDDFYPFSPAENTAEAPEYLAWMKTCAVGDKK